ncbi:putative methyltransferase domain-containing protein [Rosellinia necatrix]|uniref:Putative methyltransferase domain-containing protein n=1 Tax=Rosellinia necatrix TaxID=77044 RepID=A0A1W2TPX9_ROSNE|nr:putative methyltransferase domain-containing protein [Rosellinia necatrix]
MPKTDSRQCALWANLQRNARSSAFCMAPPSSEALDVFVVNAPNTLAAWGSQADGIKLLAPKRPRRRISHSQRKVQARQSKEMIVQWLSPRSEHFPTPRGFHFMAAPILPDSPSTASLDESNSPSTSSNPWNRTSISTDVTEFDDIYDVSDDEECRQRMARASSQRRHSTAPAGHSRNGSAASHRGLPPLIIPTQQDANLETWSGRPDRKKLASSIPPTPPAKVEISPAVISYIQSQQAQVVPTISAPPSLDGSFTSDQMAVMSAPVTPVMASDDEVHLGDWSGIQLQPAALATLQALSGIDDADDEYLSEQVIEVPEERIPEMRQQTRIAGYQPSLRLTTGQQQQQTIHGLTRLDIPSPGGFFSGLSPRARHTWHLPLATPEDIAPPTSTTAEQFYRCPWQDAPVPAPQQHAYFTAHSAPVEHIVEIRGTMSDGMPTARPIIVEQVVETRNAPLEGPITARRIEHRSPSSSPIAPAEPMSPYEELVATEIVAVYDPEYAKKQQAVALSNLDRTEHWLMAQKVYLQGVHPEEEVQSTYKLEQDAAELSIEDVVKQVDAGLNESPATPKKKAVRFSEAALKADIPRTLPPKFARKESAYYRAFQDYIIRSRQHDTFVHRLPRFEALQAQRISLREAHRNRLLGKYQLSVVPQSARKRMSANVVRGDDVIVDDPERIKREKEDEAFTQMATANWHVSAIKALNGGQLFSAPISKQLARLSRVAGAQNRTRILDIGGQATCDWAWHCAITYPNAKVYTVTTKAIRQMSNCNMRGPSNHRQVAVERFTRLPFPDAHFDLVSARELHSIIKFIGENGEDEWEGCLSEIMRVLKPGGYLDFSVMDSDIMNAGPLGLAKSVEFGFSLKTLGYDPNPTRLFLGRLGRAGFNDIRRVWMCLPMGHTKRPAGEKPLPVVRDSNGIERSLELQAIVQGSTTDAASITGLAGGWTWERWLLRCEMEKVAGEGRLWLDPADVREAGKCLEGVHDVIEEGRGCGAGYRMLNGFARKPRQEKRGVV